MRKAKKKSVIRFLSLLTALTLLFACAGCGNTTAQPEESNQQQEQTADKQPVEGNTVGKDTAEEKDTVPDAKDDTSEKKETSVEKTPVEKADTPKDNDTSASGTTTPSVKKVVTVSISCATILNNKDACDAEVWSKVPGDGVILSSAEVSISNGETVYDALRKACEGRNIAFDADSYGFIHSIAGISESAVGPESGWTFTVNGKFEEGGAKDVLLENGDTVEWLYTCNFGADVGFSW